MFHKLLTTTLLALFVVAASASAPEEQAVGRAIGDPCSATDPCVGGVCCLARKRGVLQARGTCVPSHPHQVFSLIDLCRAQTSGTSCI
ncbi:hypothetical protein DFH09DRAFT_1124224 [Mycena vulgaris]|nr:hypothetical protein DFH09DRAFT_1124224 [Mycena vulgaris]